MTNRQVARIFPVLLLSPLSWGAVDQSLLDLAPANSRILFGVNVPAALGSPLGQQIFKRVLANNPAIDRYGTTLGFDPKRDLKELVFAASGSSSKLFHYDLIVARGSFRPDRFMTVANLAGAKTVKVNGKDIVTPPASALHTSFAFVDASTLLLGSPEILRAALSQPPGSSPATTKKALAASAANDAWFATGTPVSQLLTTPRSPAFLPFLDLVRESAGGMKFHGAQSTLSVDATTRSDVDALTIAGVLRTAAQSLHNPRTSELRNAQFTVTGATLHGTINIMEADLERMFGGSTAVGKRR